jgi:hypothetical protein
MVSEQFGPDAPFHGAAWRSADAAMHACQAMKSGGPTISSRVKPMNGHGGAPTNTMDSRRPTPPKKIISHSARNNTVSRSMRGISTNCDTPYQAQSTKKKRRLLSSTACAGKPAVERTGSLRSIMVSTPETKGMAPGNPIDTFSEAAHVSAQPIAYKAHASATPRNGMLKK